MSTKVKPADAGRAVKPGKGLLGAGLRRPEMPAEKAGIAPGVAGSPRVARRPLVVLVSAALVLLGALLSVLAYSSLGNAQEVVAVRADVARGELITADALQIVRVGVDPALNVVPAAEMDALVGQRASADMRAGQLVVPSAVTEQVLPRAGYSVVGLSLGEGQVPLGTLEVGDRVRVVSTPGVQGDVVDTELRVFEATVVSIAASDVSGKVGLMVEVGADQAAELAARAATGKLAVVLDSRER